MFNATVVVMLVMWFLIISTGIGANNHATRILHLEVSIVICAIIATMVTIAEVMG